MSANIELALLTRVITDRDFQTLDKLHITEDYFLTEEGRQVYKHLRDTFHHPNTMGQVPSLDMLRWQIPAFYPANCPDTVPILAAELRREKMRVELHVLRQTLEQMIDVDPRRAAAELRAKAQSIATIDKVGEEVSLSSAVTMLRQNYEMVAQARGMLGIPYPWAQLNEETQGMLNSQFIVLYGRPGSMKCVCEGQRVMQADGSYTAIEDVPKVTRVPSYTAANGLIRFASAERVVSGLKESVAVTTESGLQLRTSTEHLYMVPGGTYKKIQDLRPGDFIATSRNLPKWEHSSKLSEEDAHFLGILVGDGNYTRNEVQFTTTDDDLVESIRLHAGRHGALVTHSDSSISYGIVGTSHGEGSNPVLNWLKKLELHGLRSNEKRVPKTLFSSSPAAVIGFLAGLMDTDGCIFSTGAAWSTSSKGMAQDLQHLLMRFGIRGHILETITNFNTTAYEVRIYGQGQLNTLSSLLAPSMRLNRKKELLLKLGNTKIIEENTVKDNQTIEDRQFMIYVEAAVQAYQLFANGGSATKVQEAVTEIIWEKIDSISPLGALPCYDICITDGQDPNFVVEGFVVHNSWTGIAIAEHAYTAARKKVLIYSKEMPVKLFLMRLAATICKVDYKLFRNGKLPPEVSARVWETMDDLKDDEKALDIHSATGGAWITVVSDRGQKGGVAWFQSKIREYKPDFAIVDGLYLMGDDRSGKRDVDWKSIAHISQDMKLTANESDIPILGITQASRKGDKDGGQDLTDIAYSDALGQDADAAFHVALKKKTDENGIKSAEIYLRAPKGREFEFDGIVIHGRPAWDFTYARMLTSEDSEDEKKAGNNTYGNGPQSEYRGRTESQFKDPRIPIPK